MGEGNCDLLIVGAGPAGMRAAIAARDGGLSVTVVNEGMRPGGQIYRGVQTMPHPLVSVLGAEYAAGRALADAFSACAMRYLSHTAVFMIEKRDTGGFEIGVSSGTTARMITARAVLIATGALERPFPIQGWTLPGVMTAGGAQTMLKASGAVPSGPTVLAGTGPLLYLLAAQYARAGIKLVALLDTTPTANWRAALTALPGFLVSRNVRKGLRLLREASAHPILRNVGGLAASGDGRLEQVAAQVGGREHRFVAQTLLLHQGVVPQVNLALAAGAAHHWNETRLAFEPRVTADGESTVAGLFIAGDSAGIAGADAAEHRGLVAALAILDRLEAPDREKRERVRSQARAALAKAMRGRAFLDRLYRPAPQFRMPADDVMVCRCEEVTAGEIRALTARGAQGPNQAKAFSRAGMGPCQGRGCALSVTEIMAHASGRDPGDIGHMRIRAPVKPVTVGQMAALSASEAYGRK